jgi:hypothetical protein
MPYIVDCAGGTMIRRLLIVTWIGAGFVGRERLT